MEKWEYLELYIYNLFYIRPSSKVTLGCIKSLVKFGSTVRENLGQWEITYQTGEYHTLVKFTILDYLGSEGWEICGLWGDRELPFYYLFKRKKIE
jgi:hypothetical protein